MDPLAHTLLGATAAEAGLGRRSRYATATLLVGANLPDVDAVAVALGPDVSLAFRRGWTHGVLAMAVLPALLAAAVALWHRLGPEPSEADGPPFRFGWILVLSYLATWSHPLLDLLNTYGVRLLMPFDDRWFYGDTLFIIDPWFWLLTAAGVVLARSATRRAIVGWAVLATLATALFLVAPMVPLGVKLLWCVGVAAIVGLRRVGRASPVRVARVGLAVFVVYLGVAYGAARLAESAASRAETARTGTTPSETQANPIPGDPFSHRLVLVHPDRYRVVEADGNAFDVPRRPWPAVVRRAATDPSVSGFLRWTRFPYWRVVDTPEGATVIFRDLRYVDPDRPAIGIGEARVEVPRAGGATPTP